MSKQGQRAEEGGNASKGEKSMSGENRAQKEEENRSAQSSENVKRKTTVTLRRSGTTIATKTQQKMSGQTAAARRSIAIAWATGIATKVMAAAMPLFRDAPRGTKGLKRFLLSNWK
jgi:hypothetical protein